MFYELKLPDIEDRGEGTGKWFVHTVDNLRLYQQGALTVNADVEAIDLDDQDRYYFDREVDCHKAAAEYYRQHSMSYPYHKEWALSILGQPDGLTPNLSAPVSTTIQSEEMIF